MDILNRATDLVEKGFMPWPEAERLALSEVGIGDAQIEELQGECTSSDFITGDDISTLIRATLVHGHRLLVNMNTNVALQEAVDDAAEILDNLTKSISTHGNYSVESTLLFLSHARESLPASDGVQN